MTGTLSTYVFSTSPFVVVDRRQALQKLFIHFEQCRQKSMEWWGSVLGSWEKDSEPGLEMQLFIMGPSLERKALKQHFLWCDKGRLEPASQSK